MRGGLIGLAVALSGTAALAQSARITFPMCSSAWRVYASGGDVPCGVTSCGDEARVGQWPGGGVYVDLPAAPDAPTVAQGGSTAETDWRGYWITEPSLPALTTAAVLTLRVQVRTSGQPRFGYRVDGDSGCGRPAAIRPYLQVGRWAEAVADNQRWWAKEPYRYVLSAGEATITVPLTPSAWVQTWGKAGSSTSALTMAFVQTLGRIGAIGAAMGGGCSYGHGVNIAPNGATARLVLISYGVTR